MVSLEREDEKDAQSLKENDRPVDDASQSTPYLTHTMTMVYHTVLHHVCKRTGAKILQN